MNLETTMHGFMTVLHRDLLLGIRNRSELINPVLFFVIVVMLFALGITPEREVLRIMLPGVIWVAALLAALLSLDMLFRSDFEDGSLELIFLSPNLLYVLVLAKVTAHWLVAGLPLVVLAPALAFMLNLETYVIMTLLATLVLGTPLLSLIGSIGVALTVGLRRGGVLLALLVLPLYVPVLVFSAGAVNTAQHGLEVSGLLAILAALLILACVLVPLATAAALRISLE